MSESDATKERIARKKTELAQLEQDFSGYHGEDYRAKFRMDIANLKKSFETDEGLLKGIENG